MNKKQLSVSEAKARIYKYCAYQERCHQEVKNKLYEYGLRSYEVDELLTHLITEGFLNEERFAKAFAGGKFRMKKWGRVKITHELESRGITKNCIKIALREIDMNIYQSTLEEILTRKFQEIDEANLFVKRDKIATYAIRKGYESDLVWGMIRKLYPN